MRQRQSIKERGHSCPRDPGQRVFETRGQECPSSAREYHEPFLRLKSGLICKLAPILLALVTQTTSAQLPFLSPALPRTRFRSGEETLRAFAPVSEATRYSIV